MYKSEKSQNAQKQIHNKQQKTTVCVKNAKPEKYENTINHINEMQLVLEQHQKL